MSERMVAWLQRGYAWRLRLVVHAWRHGALHLLAIALLCLLGVLALIGMQAREHRVDAARSELAQIDARIRFLRHDISAGEPAIQDPASDLRHLLQVDDAGRDAVQAAQTIAAIMKKHQMIWTSTDYKDSRDAATGLHRVEMQIVVKAPYPLVRALAEDVLRALPRASLDGLATRRDGVEQAVPTTTMAVSIWSMGP